MDSSQSAFLLCVGLIMAALRSRCRHYIFAVWFLSSIFFSRRLDVYHILTHDVALVWI